MDTCQCGSPDELGTHWLAEDGDCCPYGCDCQDCLYWAPFTSLDLGVLGEDDNDSDLHRD